MLYVYNILVKLGSHFAVIFDLSFPQMFVCFVWSILLYSNPVQQCWRHHSNNHPTHRRNSDHPNTSGLSNHRRRWCYYPRHFPGWQYHARCCSRLAPDSQFWPRPDWKWRGFRQHWQQRQSTSIISKQRHYARCSGIDI